jgi:hypothetical protein
MGIRYLIFKGKAEGPVLDWHFSKYKSGGDF